MKPLSPTRFSPGKAILILSVLAAVVIGGYSISVALPFLRGPFLDIKPALISEDGTVSIFGETERVSFLEINGLPVALNEDGSFLVERAFPLGYTAVTVVAKDRFGRTITKSFSFAKDIHGTEKKD